VLDGGTLLNYDWILRKTLPHSAGRNLRNQLLMDGIIVIRAPWSYNTLVMFFSIMARYAGYTGMATHFGELQT
jgi:hypothetical protein